MHRSKRLQAFKRTTEKNDGDSCALWCLCCEPEDSRFVIQCDIQGRNCKVWYHGDYVGVSESQGKHMEHYGIDFICPFCSNNISDNAGGAASSSMTALPPYTELRAASFYWNDSIEGTVFCQKVSTAYDEIVHWRHNLFLVPYGRDFVHELAKLSLSYGEAGAVAMLMCALLLQKPHSQSSSRDLSNCLQRRLSLWNQGDIDALLIEGRTIQHRLLTRFGSRQNSDNHHSNRHFVECMLYGNVRSALNLLTSEQSGVPLQLNSPVSPDNPSWLVLDELKKKHPVGRPASPEVLLFPPAQASSSHPIIFYVLEGSAICSAALRTGVAAGPSGLDAHGWRRLCTSFHRASNDLCKGLASVARRLCTSFMDPAGIVGLVASRLIALDKHPGVCPIGVGEVVRRIISRAILSVVKLDILEAACYSQLCAGQDAGNEATVHAMRAI